MCKLDTLINFILNFLNNDCIHFKKLLHTTNNGFL